MIGKKAFLIIGFFFLLLISPTNVIGARNSPKVNQPDEVFTHPRESAPSPNLGIKKEIPQRTRTVWTEKKQSLIRAYFEHMITRMKAAIARLERLVSRIESRLSKIESQGTDVTALRADLNRAKIKLDQIKNDLVNVESTVNNLLASEDPKSAFAGTKTLIKKVKTSLVETHQILVHLIGKMQGLRVGNPESSTPQPTQGT